VTNLLQTENYLVSAGLVSDVARAVPHKQARQIDTQGWR
jgi:hypothetical protein